jgi:hypothetical protein
VAATWRATGIEFRKSAFPKSDIYLECVPLGMLLARLSKAQTP